jgi:putative selenate reductase molybdopterin-binding subunit
VAVDLVSKKITNRVAVGMAPLGLALADAGLTPDKIHEVVLVGGQTRMPRIQDLVRNFFGREPHKGVNPDEVVAVGAGVGNLVVGDRVAFVAAETTEIAEEALRRIEVQYEALDAILDLEDAMKPGAVQIHDEPEFVPFAVCDPQKNLAAEIRIDIGDVEKGFAEADRIFEAEYTVPKVQQAHIEPHVCVTYWDEDDRLVIRTSTQVPFHARRQLAPVLGLPVKRIRVIKPRIGGGFGGKQEVLVEDVAAHLTIATHRPVIYEHTREEEFIASRSRHPMKLHMRRV